MPILKQLECSVELAGSDQPLPEYATKYRDGFVQTYIAIPDEPATFTIHLTSSGYIAPGLAMFVFIDSQYQCNRNRRGLLSAEGEIQHVDFRVRQKEERQPDGNFIGKEWRFEKFHTSDEVTRANGRELSQDILHDIGTIEVVVLRCNESSEFSDTDTLTEDADGTRYSEDVPTVSRLDGTDDSDWSHESEYRVYEHPQDDFSDHSSLPWSRHRQRTRNFHWQYTEPSGSHHSRPIHGLPRHEREHNIRRNHDSNRYLRYSTPIPRNVPPRHAYSYSQTPLEDERHDQENYNQSPRTGHPQFHDSTRQSRSELRNEQMHYIPPHPTSINNPQGSHLGPFCQPHPYALPGAVHTTNSPNITNNNASAPSGENTTMPCTFPGPQVSIPYFPGLHASIPPVMATPLSVPQVTGQIYSGYHLPPYNVFSMPSVSLGQGNQTSADQHSHEPKYQQAERRRAHGHNQKQKARNKMPGSFHDTSDELSSETSSEHLTSRMKKSRASNRKSSSSTEEHRRRDPRSRHNDKRMRERDDSSSSSSIASVGEYHSERREQTSNFRQGSRPKSKYKRFSKKDLKVRFDLEPKFISEGEPSRPGKGKGRKIDDYVQDTSGSDIDIYHESNRDKEFPQRNRRWESQDNRRKTSGRSRSSHNNNYNSEANWSRRSYESMESNGSCPADHIEQWNTNNGQDNLEGNNHNCNEHHDTSYHVDNTNNDGWANASNTGETWHTNNGDNDLWDNTNKNGQDGGSWESQKDEISWDNNGETSQENLENPNPTVDQANSNQEDWQTFTVNESNNDKHTANWDSSNPQATGEGGDWQNGNQEENKDDWNAQGAGDEQWSSQKLSTTTSDWENENQNNAEGAWNNGETIFTQGDWTVDGKDTKADDHVAPGKRKNSRSRSRRRSRSRSNSRKRNGGSKSPPTQPLPTISNEPPRPPSPDSPICKDYWIHWNKGPYKDDVPKSEEHIPRSEQIYVAPADPVYDIPQSVAVQKGVEHQVRAGRGVHYYHSNGHPEYLDSMEEPYAVFRFKYRSKAMLEKILEKSLVEEGNDEQYKQTLLNMNKEQIIEELFRLRLRTNDTSLAPSSSKKVPSRKTY